MNKGERFTFTKEERVTGEKRIEFLFTNGRSFISYPLRVIFVERTSQACSCNVSVFISVPKKRLKLAVKRNQTKRLMREAYRLNKYLLEPLFATDNRCMDIAFVYVKNEVSEYGEMEKAIKKALREISTQFKKEGENN